MQLIFVAELRNCSRRRATTTEHEEGNMAEVNDWSGGIVPKAKAVEPPAVKRQTCEYKFKAELQHDIWVFFLAIEKHQNRFFEAIDLHPVELGIEVTIRTDLALNELREIAAQAGRETIVGSEIETTIHHTGWENTGVVDTGIL